MRKSWSLGLALALVVLLAFQSAALAFSDIKGDPGEASIRALKEAGLVNGISEDSFAPKGIVTYAQGVHMIVKAFDINLSAFLFIKAPQAADFFTQVKDDEWYSQSFIAAHVNGLPVAKEVNPSAPMPRQEFARMLMKAVSMKGDYAFIELYVMLKDETQVGKEYMDSIQKLLIAKIAQLDDDGKFRPQEPVTRSEAATMLHRALQFVKEHGKNGSDKPSQPDKPAADEQVTLHVDKVNDQVNKVTLSWGQKPNPGYRIVIKSIHFPGDGTAVIRYQLHKPEPGRMYAQVITEAKAETYLSNEYRVVTEIASDN